MCVCVLARVFACICVYFIVKNSTGALKTIPIINRDAFKYV